jgi:hypothetical protein
MNRLLLILLLLVAGLASQTRYVLSRAGFQPGGGTVGNDHYRVHSHFAIQDLGSMKSLTYHTGPYTKVEKLDGTIPGQFELRQNYPNPYNQCTRIQFEIPRPARVHVDVYSSLGQKVAHLVDGEYAVGRYQIYYTGVDDSGRLCASGVYFIRFYTENWSKTIKTAVLR